MERYLWIILCGLIALWALTGGMHYGTAMAIAGVSSFCAAWLTIREWQMRRQKPELSPDNHIDKNLSIFHGFGCLGWMLLVMILLTCVSLIPMPLAVIDVISPRTAAWYREAWELEGITRNWGFLTLSLGRTAYGLWNLIACLGIYLTALRLGGTRGTIQAVSHVFVIVGCVLVMMLGLRHLGMHVSFGAFGETSAWHLGLPVNVNHLSTLFVLFSLMSLGAFLTRRHRDVTARKAIWLLLYILFGACVVMLASRGAILAWIAGQVIFWVVVSGVQHQRPWKYGACILGALGAVLLVILFMSSSKLVEIQEEFTEADIAFDYENGDNDVAPEPTRTFSKTQMYSDFATMAGDWWRTGIGRSAFRDVYPQYQSFPFRKTFRHAENEYWEILLDYGVFWGMICLILGLMGIASLLKTFWNAKDERTVVVGLLAGMLAVIIQNFFDFGLRYLTVGFPFWLVCGLLQARRLRWNYGRVGHDHTQPGRWQILEWRAGHCIAAASLAAAAVLTLVAVDGQTQKSLHQLAGCTAQKNIESCANAIDSNLIRRSGSHELRRFVAQRYIRESSRMGTDERQHFWKIARKWYESSIQKFPRDAATALRLGKCCHALGDETCAAHNYMQAAQNSSRIIPDAMYEMAALPIQAIEVPKQMPILKALIQALTAQNRIQDAISLLIPIQKTHSDDYVSMMCHVYKRMAFDEGCSLLLTSIPPNVLTPDIFRLRIDDMLIKGQYDAAFQYMASAESALKNSYEYWRKYLYTSVYQGKTMGDDWYREQVPRILLKVKQLSPPARTRQFDLYLCEAHYALEIGQKTRAENFAKHALAIRPNHREAQKILQAAQAE